MPAKGRATKKALARAAAASQRSVPTQARSRERYDRILDAAATEFAQRGFEASTMEGIAARAESSIGSVYRFFLDKGAVYEALVAKYLEGSRAVFDALFAEGTARGSRRGRAPSWSALIDQSVDAFAAFDRSSPAVRAIWTNLHAGTSALSAALEANRAFAARVETLLERHARALPRARRPLVATMIVETLTSSLSLAARTDEGAFSKEIVEETKVLLKRYLGPYARTPRAARATRGEPAETSRSTAASTPRERPVRARAAARATRRG